MNSSKVQPAFGTKNSGSGEPWRLGVTNLKAGSGSLKHWRDGAMGKDCHLAILCKIQIVSLLLVDTQGSMHVSTQFARHLSLKFRSSQLSSGEWDLAGGRSSRSKSFAKESSEKKTDLNAQAIAPSNIKVHFSARLCW